MSIYHNGKEYGATKVINYSASPDYNRGVTVDNIQSGNYQATDNGFLFIQLQSQQSNPTKVSVVRSKTPITDTGTEIASIVLSQYQYSETLTAQVMAREYYKLVIEGVGNPQVLSCVFYPYATTVPIKLTEDISIEQVEGLENELAGKQDVGDYATSNELTQGLAGKQDAGDYATSDELTQGLAGKQDVGNYFNNDTDKLNLANQVENVLGIAHGGHGGTTKDKARSNLEAFRHYYIKDSSTADEKNLDKIFMTGLMQSNSYCTNYPTGAGNWGFLLQFYHREDRTTQIYYDWNGNEWKRTRTGTQQWNTWNKIRNKDGSIPAELISPTVLKYENSDGVWTETKLTTGEVMLEGWGVKGFTNLPINTMNSADIILPKGVNYKKSTINTQGVLSTSVQPPEEGDYYTSAGINTNSCFIRITNTSNKTALHATVRWYFRGILA